jgi:YegS/Rv2252/BmrU family lipid kinase
MNGPVLFVNPHSGLGRAGRQLAALRAQLSAQLGEHQLCLTEGRGHAAQLARDAALGGATQLIVCGGDGTLGEAADGLLRSGRAAHVLLSALPCGTGGDFTRSLAADGAERRIDVALAHYLDERGRPQSRHVLNVASVGLSAEAVRWIEEQARRGRRHRLSYVVSAFAAFARYAVGEVDIQVDGASVLRGPLSFCAIANGRFFGGGMQVAPCARLDDGQLDVTAVDAMPLWEAVPFFARLLRGAHLADRRTHLGRGSQVTVSSAAALPFEIDGEPVGKLPVRVIALPGALRLRALQLGR